ncbi:MAG: hypothetical protein R3C40_03200 [Parvularculaceae bacterium]
MRRRIKNVSVGDRKLRMVHGHFEVLLFRFVEGSPYHFFGPAEKILTPLAPYFLQALISARASSGVSILPDPQLPKNGKEKMRGASISLRALAAINSDVSSGFLVIANLTHGCDAVHQP